MMAALFLLFFVAIILAWYRVPRLAVVLALVTLALCVAMFFYHMTTPLEIQL